MEGTPQQRDSRENRRHIREEETPDQCECRLERDRNRARRRREEEPPDQRQRHLERERDRARRRREEETPHQHDRRLETTRARRSEETPEHRDHRLEQSRMQDQAWRLLMSSEEASIARSAAASRQQQSRANETPQQQQTHRTADATRHQDSWANEAAQQQRTRRTADAIHHQDSRVNETPQQQQTRRTANANRQQQRRNSNGPLFEAAFQCNIDRTNHMEGVELYTLGPMDMVCQFCGAIGFKSEKRNGQVSFGKLCCNGNKTHPGNLLKTPLHRNLVEPFTGTTPQARFFRTHIRQFNSQFAMASLIIDHDATISNRFGGAAAFRIMGELHRNVGAVHGNYGRYIQTYFYDVQQQNQHRIAAFPQQHQQRALETVDKIQVALEESNNTYIQTFKSIQQIESEIEQTTGQSI